MHRSVTAGLRRHPAYESARLAVALSACGVLGLVVGLGYAGHASHSVKIAAAAFAMIFGLAGAALALLRFEAFLLMLFAIRPVLDAAKNGGYGNIAPGDAVALVFLVVGVLWLVARHRSGTLHRLGGLSIALVALTLAGLVSVVAAKEPANSGESVLTLASGLLMFLVLEQVVLDDTGRLRSLYVATCGVTVLASVVAIVEGAVGDSADGRVRGLFVHENAMAQYLVTVTLLMLALRPQLSGGLRRLTTVTFLLAMPALYLTYARGAWIGFVVGVLVIGILQDKRLVVGGLVVITSAVIFIPGITHRFSDLGQSQVQVGVDPNSFAWREQYWHQIAGLANSTPIVGIGLGMVEKTTAAGLAPHNTPLEVWLETGAVGSLAFLGVAGSMAWGLRRALRALPRGLSRGWAVGASAAAIAYGLEMLTDNLLLQAMQLWYLALAVAPALALGRLAAPSGRVEHGASTDAGEPVTAREAARVDVPARV